MNRHRSLTALAIALAPFAGTAAVAQPTIDYPGDPLPTKAFILSNPGLTLNIAANAKYTGRDSNPVDFGGGFLNILNGGTLLEDDGVPVVYENVNLDIEEGGEVERLLFWRGDSTIDVNGGTLGPNGGVSVNTTLNINDGLVNAIPTSGIENGYAASSGAVVNLDGGTLVGPVDINDDAHFHMTGGLLNDVDLFRGEDDPSAKPVIEFNHNATGLFVGGQTDGRIRLEENSVVDVTGGLFNSGTTAPAATPLGRFIVYDDATLNINGGSFDPFGISALDNADVNIDGGDWSGGTATNDTTLSVSRNVTADITDGTFEDFKLLARQDSHVTISGGEWRDLEKEDATGRAGIFRVVDDAILELVGTQFVINEGESDEQVIDVDPGESYEFDLTNGFSNGEFGNVYNDLLTATLADGNEFGMKLISIDFDPNEEADFVSLSTGATLRLTAVIPEPSSLVTVIIAGAFALRRRRR